MTAATALFGSTGLVGSHILSVLLASDAYPIVQTVSRRAPPSEGPKLNAVLEADTAQWTAKLAALAPAPATVYSAVGTTRAQAGGLENQRKIDHDLCIDIARGAKAAGAKTFVFISSDGVDGALAGSLPYFQMKQGVEAAIRDLDFDHAIIVRPALILGQREVAHTAGGFMNSFVRGLGSVFGQGAQDAFGQEAGVIAKAAVHAARLANEGKAPSKLWYVEKKDIVRLGRTEWTD